MLDLVEQVRQLTKEAKSADSEASAQDVQSRLAELTIEQATALTRAFTQYFLLANAAEQVYRVRALQERPSDESWMPRTVRAVHEELGAEGTAGGGRLPRRSADLHRPPPPRPRAAPC